MMTNFVMKSEKVERKWYDDFILYILHHYKINISSYLPFTKQQFVPINIHIVIANYVHIYDCIDSFMVHGQSIFKLYKLQYSVSHILSIWNMFGPLWQ